jgi:phage shock protein PspC (stress-responsive transcriptional regulator)
LIGDTENSGIAAKQWSNDRLQPDLLLLESALDTRLRAQKIAGYEPAEKARFPQACGGAPMLNRTQAKQLFIGGIIALLLAGTLVVAGSHFRVNLQNGSSLDVKFGAESSGLVTLLGFAGIAAIIAGAVIWVQNPADNSSAGPDAPYTASATWERLRHLTLSKTDCKVGGVCGGLGEHTAIPAWMWRVIFLVLLCWVGTGLLAYVILWICVPNPPPAGEDPPKNP